MKSAVDFNAKHSVWAAEGVYSGSFDIEWIYVKVCFRPQRLWHSQREVAVAETLHANLLTGSSDASVFPDVNGISSILCHSRREAGGKYWLTMLGVCTCAQDVSNSAFKYLTNPWNEGKSVVQSRDCQELPTEQAFEMLRCVCSLNSLKIAHVPHLSKHAQITRGFFF